VAISNARALRAESGCIKALRPLLPRKSGEPLCSSLAKDNHHPRTKMLSAVFAVTVKRPAMSARKVLAHVKLCGWGLPRDAVPCPHLYPKQAEASRTAVRCRLRGSRWKEMPKLPEKKRKRFRLLPYRVSSKRNDQLSARHSEPIPRPGQPKLSGMPGTGFYVLHFALVLLCSALLRPSSSSDSGGVAGPDAVREAQLEAFV
jgi:hypothetical protein